MTENFEPKANTHEPEREETLNERQERLRAVLTASLEVFQDPERRLEEGVLTVVRRLRSGETETLFGLVVVEMLGDGVGLCGIEEDGGPSASATMGWEEIINVTKEAAPGTTS
ncbi:MAG: hypothetical protein HYS57_02060 [Parcubacteria group bacterium]|nr:hypothetical protein [Parcubacteria group bacterium]